MIFRAIVLIVLVASVVSIIACSGGGGGSNPAAVLSQKYFSVHGQIEGENELGGVPVYLIAAETNTPPAGLILATGEDAKNSSQSAGLAIPVIRANVIGQIYTSVTDASGNFEFLDVLEGNYNLIAQKDRYNSGILRDIRALSDVTNLKIRLTPTGQISGTVSVPNNFSKSGVTVFVKGTSYAAFSGDQGEYQITGIPIGTYTVAFTAPGLKQGIIETALVSPGATTNLPLVTLSVDTAFFIMGPQGPQGPTGTAGVSITWKGSLAAAPASPQLNWAYYNTADGKGYIYDGLAWQIMVQDGVIGPQGPTGSTGPQGPTGTAGVSITWKGSLAAAPASPQINWAYYNTADGKGYIYDGSVWQILVQDGVIGPQGPTGSTGPTGATGSAGVSITWKGSLAVAPANPQLNWAYYNTADKKAYIYDGNAWQILAQDGVLVGDSDAPLTSSFMPANGSTGGAIDEDLVLTFNENVYKNTTGDIVIKRTSNNSIFETVSVSSARVSISGAQAIINPSAVLESSTSYYVQVAATCFKDLGGNFFAGISDTTTWAFTSADATPPNVNTFNPADDASGVLIDSALVITFNETIKRGSAGNITIKRIADNSVFESIPATNSSKVTISGAQATIIPTATFADQTGYYVQVDSTCFKDNTGNYYAGINNNTTWNFTSADGTPPIVTILSPLDNAINVATGANLVLTFNENISKGATGDISIKRTINNIPFETIPVTDARVTVAGNQATINPDANLNYSTGYYVRIANTCFKDATNNNHAGITDNTTWDFTTTSDSAGPVAVSYVPTDGSVFIATNSNLVLTLDENVFKGTTGDVVIKKLSDNSVVETIPIASSNITISGAQVTINPVVTLAIPVDYYIQIAGTCFKDLAGNNYAGIADNTTWNFSTIVPGVNWVQTANGPFSARHGHTSVVYDNKMWVIGGSSGGKEVWNSSDGITWNIATTSAAFSARSAHTSVVFNNKMWVIGGWDGTRKNDVWSSSDGITWNLATSSAAFSPRSEHGSVVFGGKMWVFMSVIDAQNWKDDAWNSADGVEWVEMTSNMNLPDDAKWSFSTAVFNDKIWIIGGNTYNWNDNRNVQYSSDGINWQFSGLGPWNLRRGSSTAIYEGKIWLIGGYTNNPSTYFKDVWYSSTGYVGGWYSATSTANFSARQRHSTVVFDNKMWVIGGHDGTNALNDVWYSGY
ncbi:Ig-like domain-containing protein [bacterium]|nr:Ig-like domain-containing protein [bacterium]